MWKCKSCINFININSVYQSNLICFLSLFFDTSVSLLHVRNRYLIKAWFIFVHCWTRDMFLIVCIFNSKLQWLWFGETDYWVLGFNKGLRFCNVIGSNIGLLRLNRFPTSILLINGFYNRPAWWTFQDFHFLWRVEVNN